MASLRDIKHRKTSIQSTQQITKAMKLVSTVKLQKARSHAEQANPYFSYMYHTVTSLLARAYTIDHPYLKSGSSEKKAVVVISSNRGLAGGYNTNIVKLITGSNTSMEDVKIYAIGRKAREGLERKGYQIAADYSEVMESPTYAEAMTICKDVLNAFTTGKVGEIYLAYTHFKNTVSHVPTLMKLLPVELGKKEPVNIETEFTHEKPARTAEARTEPITLMNFEPSEEEALNIIIPKYITSLFYGALVEAIASENGARMQAMDSATNNAEELINDLSLKYNRARQGSITQELTEIIAGAGAIS